MAFVFEYLDQAATLDLKNKVSKFQTVMSMAPVQVIDRDRKIIFAVLGGRGELASTAGEPPDYFALLWNDDGIAFEGRRKNEYLAGTMKTTFDLEGLRIPKHLHQKLDDIHRAIQDAMTVFLAAQVKVPVQLNIIFPAHQYL